MTQPSGKSPARLTSKPSQIDLDQASLIDVSLSDDSLLSARIIKAVPRNPSVVSVAASPKKGPDTGCAVKAITAFQEDLPKCQQEVCSGVPEQTVDPNLPVLTEEPVLKKKKQKSRLNLRKSLAWDNAFLAEEGVLDSEELSMVNITFQKFLYQPKPSSHKKPILNSKLLKPPMMPKINFSSISSHETALTVSSQQSQAMPAVNTPRSSTGSIAGIGYKRYEPHVNNGKVSIGIRHGVVKPPLLSRVQADSFKQDKSMVPACEFFESKPLLPKKAIDKKIAGPLMPCVTGDNEKHGMPLVEVDSGVCVVATASESVPIKGASISRPVIKDSRLTSQSANAEANRCPPHIKAMGECLPSTGISRSQLVPRSRFISETASTKTDSSTKKSSPFEGSRILLSRDKPSGLRMPSPKLGFFDMSRTAPQVAVLCERTNGHGYKELDAGKNITANKLDTGVNRLRNNSKQKLPAASAKSRHLLSETSKFQARGVRISSSIPSAPHVRSAEVASMSAAMVHGSSRPSSNLSDRIMDGTEQVLQAKKNVQNVSLLGKTVLSQPDSSLARDTRGQENLYPDCQEGKGMLQRCIVAQGLAPRNHNKKESGRTWAPDAPSPSKKIVSQLLSCASHNALGHENAEASHEGVLQTCMVDEDQNAKVIERACVRVFQTSEEWPQVKSGLVQNSPPNKVSPKHGPWSPVQRNTEQPGPFDCTKFVNTGIP